MQILFGHLVKKKKKRQSSGILLGNTENKKEKNIVFEDTIILLSLYEIRKCLLSKTISLFSYSTYLRTEDLTAALMEKPCWYF